MMEIKTSADIVREALKDDDCTPDCMSFMDEQKKWIAVDDLLKVIEDKFVDFVELGKKGIPLTKKNLKEYLKQPK